MNFHAAAETATIVITASNKSVSDTDNTLDNYQMLIDRSKTFTGILTRPMALLENQLFRKIDRMEVVVHCSPYVLLRLKSVHRKYSCVFGTANRHSFAHSIPLFKLLRNFSQRIEEKSCELTANVHSDFFHFNF